MQYQDERKSARHKDSAGGFLAELGFDIVEEFLPDSLIGCVLLILAVVFVLVIRSAMNE